MFALRAKISTKHDNNNKNYSDTHYVGNGPVQIVKVEKSTLHKWVKADYSCNVADITPNKRNTLEVVFRDPIVQSIVSLTSSFITNSLTVVAKVFQVH